MAPVELVERRPTVAEYRRLIAVAGWKPRDALAERVESGPYVNTWVGLFPVEGTADFYARFGYEGPAGPAMDRWLNRR